MRRLLIAVAGLLAAIGVASAQDFGDTPYVQTPQNVVDRMLQMAHVDARDYVIDLGSGDGRLVITAAKKYGARGFGVDLDRRLVELANRGAARAGVRDRAVFYERDIYQTDLSAASVVTIYLLPEVNLMLRPTLLSTLKPGTRIVTHDYDMGEWQPDEQIVMDAPDKPVGRDKKSKVFYWVVPGNAAGKWRWELPVAARPAVFEMTVAQNFQKISGNATVDGRALALSNARLDRRGRGVRTDRCARRRALRIRRPPGRPQHQRQRARVWRRGAKPARLGRHAGRTRRAGARAAQAPDHAGAAGKDAAMKSPRLAAGVGDSAVVGGPACGARAVSLRRAVRADAAGGGRGDAAAG